MRNSRRDLIREIMALRNSSVISYIGGDRQTISTRVATDIIPVIYNHLKQMSNTDKIDLFLFTKGGDVLTTLRLAHLFYEYTGNFAVLIPHKAYSAGTLIALGASEIVMTKMGELSPVDPNVTSIFNPDDPKNPPAKLPISVEDVYSFFSVAKDILGIRSEDALVQVLAQLGAHVSPLAIGNIHRTHSLIRIVAKKLLSLHMGDEQLVNQIVDNLTERLFSHSYMISRKEAGDALGLPVTYPEDELEDLMWKLYLAYMRDYQLNEPFVPEVYADRNGQFSACCGIIESLGQTHEYLFEGVIHSTDQNAVDNVNILEQGWKKTGGSKWQN